MPNRIIKESICTSDSLERLSWFEEVLFYRLIVNCDDYGRYDARPAIIKNRLFPLKEEQLSLAMVTEGLQHLSDAGLITVYEVGGKPFLFLPTWNAHQTIRAKRSKYPAPDDGMITHEIICKQMQADVPVIQSNPIQSESNASIGTRNASRFVAPTREEVKAYCDEQGINIDVDYFFDHYSGNGWKAGRVPMKDWKATVRNWYRRDQKKPTGAKIKTPYDGLRSETKGDDADRLAERFGVNG